MLNLMQNSHLFPVWADRPKSLCYDVTMVVMTLSNIWVKRYLQYWHHNGRTIKSNIYSTDITMVEQSNKPLNGSNDIYCCRYRLLFESDIYCENTVLGDKYKYNLHRVSFDINFILRVDNTSRITLISKDTRLRFYLSPNISLMSCKKNRRIQYD